MRVSVKIGIRVDTAAVVEFDMKTGERVSTIIG